MLVLIGPSFDGSESGYHLMAELMGLVAYDLKTKVRPGTWGVARVLADEAQARDLVRSLKAAGFPAELVDVNVAHDATRRVVKVDALSLDKDSIGLTLAGGRMDVPYGALVAIVRGEVRPGRREPRTGSSSTSSLRMIAPSAAEVAVFRESVGQGTEDSYPGADAHFFTVNWVARLDARHLDFSLLPNPSGNRAQDLRTLTDLLAERSGAFLDDNIRRSSLASFAGRPPPMRPSSAPQSEPRDDFQFTAYSRLLAQAERQRRVPG